MNYENLIVPPIKDLEIAADFLAQYLKYQVHVEIEEQYLDRKLSIDEKKSLLVEFMLDHEYLQKEKYE